MRRANSSILVVYGRGVERKTYLVVGYTMMVIGHKSILGNGTSPVIPSDTGATFAACTIFGRGRNASLLWSPTRLISILTPVRVFTYGQWHFMIAPTLFQIISARHYTHFSTKRYLFIVVLNDVLHSFLLKRAELSAQQI